jgi:hypothetical protein
MQSTDGANAVGCATEYRCAFEASPDRRVHCLRIFEYGSPVAPAGLSRAPPGLQFQGQMITATTFTTAGTVYEALERLGLSHGGE